MTASNPADLPPAHARPTQPDGPRPAGPGVVGLILAGGLGRRMGGVEKALVPLEGRPLAARVADILAPQVDELLLNANGPPALYAGLGLEVLPDPLPDRPGPLAGVLAGLLHLAAARPAALGLVTAAADSPFLPGDLVARLLRRHLQTGGIVCARSGGRRHPVAAFWPPGEAAPLRAFLQAGERKVGLFLVNRGAVDEEWPAEPADPFFNINTLEDLAAARAWLGAER